ncbi:hypothetical protein [Bacillus phage vB_Bpu_PumA1]|uniref:Uncharacterized protein n=1 Tax=Bacillus phage vB_Bpu_PumA1 TaxID=2662127 RepID=A0A5Q2WD70_9CAUD|nr:dsDNA binding protein [Bacillus phage vB_Bpu_PumA1]QGH74204.1 hypothetical protein [Bacillus phage vB_Bpu_PumA1]
MAKFITRQITQTKVQAHIVTMDENGNMVAEPIEPIVLEGNVSADKAQQKLNQIRKGQAPATVSKVEPTTEHFRMETLKFAELAEKIDQSQVESQEF